MRQNHERRRLIRNLVTIICISQPLYLRSMFVSSINEYKAATFIQCHRLCVTVRYALQRLRKKDIKIHIIDTHTHTQQENELLSMKELSQFTAYSNFFSVALYVLPIIFFFFSNVNVGSVNHWILFVCKCVELKNANVRRI